MAMRVYESKFDAALLDRLLAGRDPRTVLDSNGLIGELKAALAERMLSNTATRRTGIRDISARATTIAPN
ncbi:MAG: hypothetical protein ACREPL_06350, partial [Rhodanobacteraceae bacterium]